jgi:hypothetical protein
MQRELQNVLSFWTECENLLPIFHTISISFHLAVQDSSNIGLKQTSLSDLELRIPDVDSNHVKLNGTLLKSHFLIF